VPARAVGAQPARAVPRPATPRTSTPRPAAPRVRSTPSSTPRSTASHPAARPDGGGRGGSGGGRGQGGRAESVQQRVPRLFTVRALVMLIVLSIAFVLVFPTLRQYLDQQVQLEQLRAQVAAAEQDNDDLQAELDRWSDPAYVEAQARERLAFVMPGERALRVSDPEVVPEETTGTDTSAGVAVEADPSRPWYAQIWDSVQVAGAAGTGTTVDEESAGTGDNGSASTGDATDGATPSSTP
jgi:cell division protein FtsB